jgi:hypothetical protein
VTSFQFKVTVDEEEMPVIFTGEIIGTPQS